MEPRHCERSEAIQGRHTHSLDRFVASLLAMTLYHQVMILSTRLRWRRTLSIDVRSAEVNRDGSPGSCRRDPYLLRRGGRDGPTRDSRSDIGISLRNCDEAHGALEYRGPCRPQRSRCENLGRHTSRVRDTLIKPASTSHGRGLHRRNCGDSALNWPRH